MEFIKSQIKEAEEESISRRCQIFSLLWKIDEYRNIMVSRDLPKINQESTKNQPRINQEETKVHKPNSIYTSKKIERTQWSYALAQDRR